MNEFGFIPAEFKIIRGEGDLKTIFISESALVPSVIPEGAIFLAKEKGTIEDFVQLFTFFDESFEQASADIVIFCLGTNDVSKTEKQLEFNSVTNTLDFHTTRKRSNRLVSQAFNTLCDTLSKLKNTKNIISFDIMSKSSSGFHNGAVEFVNRRVERASEQHKHLNTWKRYQRDHRRKKKDKAENFPLNDERFDADGGLKDEERQILVTAALRALDSDDDSICVGDAHFRRKF